MVKKTYKDKLLDPRWQKKRLEILQRDNWECQYCSEKEQTLHIHHFAYSKSGNPWDVDDTALVCLCCDCHEAIEYQRKYLSDLNQALFDHSFWACYMLDKKYMKELMKIILLYKKTHI